MAIPNFKMEKRGGPLGFGRGISSELLGSSTYVYHTRNIRFLRKGGLKGAL